MPKIRPAAPSDFPHLTTIWRQAVEATHAFLTSSDIDALEPEVDEGLRHVPVWVAEPSPGAPPAAFMALEGNKIEALFVSPAWFGKGLGTLLVNHARALSPPGLPVLVDVNEANPSGCGFYAALGFREISRSPTDSAGRPWPLLHLELGPTSTGRNK